MKLISCPFCGKQPMVWQDEESGPGGPIPTDYVIECCVTLRASTERQAINRWNTRQPPKCKCGKPCHYYGPHGGFSVRCADCNATANVKARERRHRHD
jgi:hypothetical protein